MKNTSSIFLLLGLLLVSCGKSEPSSSGVDSSATSSTSEEKTIEGTAPIPPAISFTCTLNGKPWEGTSGSNSFFKGGSKMMDPTGAPYLMLAFPPANAPDNRQFTLSVKNFSGAVGAVLKGNMEIIFAGAESGVDKESLILGLGEKDKGGDFSLEITKYETKSPTEVLMSGKISGTLKASLMGENVKLENGEFHDVRVVVYTEKY
jgi:hypothetical protein